MGTVAQLAALISDIADDADDGDYVVAADSDEDDDDDDDDDDASSDSDSDSDSGGNTSSSSSAHTFTLSDTALIGATLAFQLVRLQNATADTDGATLTVTQAAGAEEVNGAGGANGANGTDGTGGRRVNRTTGNGQGSLFTAACGFGALVFATMVGQLAVELLLRV